MESEPSSVRDTGHFHGTTGVARAEADPALAAVFESVPIGVAIVGGDGRVRRSNRTLQQILGLDPTARSFDSICAGLSVRRVALPAGAGFIAYVDHDHERQWLDALIELSPAGILVIEGPPPVRVRANRRAREIFGTPLDAPLAMARVQSQIHDAHGVAVPLDQLPSARVMRGETLLGAEYIVRREDGTDVRVRGSAVPIRDASGVVTGVIGLCEDITSQTELENLRRDWTAIVAHDLRQPVSAIEILRGILTEQVGDCRELTLIDVACRRLQRLIADLTDATAIDARQLQLHPEPVELEAIANACAERFRLAHPDRELTVVSDEPAFVHADPLRIEQVFDNLLANAVKYGAGPIEIAVVGTGDQIEVRISNGGRGITADELPFVFDRYRRTRAARDSNTAGLGLGLFIVRGIVRAHGGRVAAESVPDVRTTFRFSLPIERSAR